MVIKGLIENDMVNCEDAIKKDLEVQDLQSQLYSVLDNLDNLTAMRLEGLFSAHFSKGLRIGYIQGMKDMNSLAGELKQNTIDIINSIE